jgi:RNA polymerase sigma-70 factor (ECF subfamily)
MTSGNLNDIELWQLIRDGNRNAFALLYRRHMRALYAVIYKWINNSSDAEDILQEVFLDLWEKRQDIQIRQNLFNYLYSITRFKVFDHVKNRQLSSQQMEIWNKMESHRYTNNVSQEMPEVPDAALDLHLAQFPPQMKLVYRLRFHEEKSIGDIAAQLNVSASTVKNHLQRIRKRLQETLAKFTSLLISFFLLWIG